MTPSRRSFLLAGTSALALAPLLAACGSDSDSTAPTGGSGSGGASADPDAFPVTITHKYGETTIESAPQRVVCVGLTDQDALLALGIVPVGVTYWFGDEEEQGIYPWAQDALGDAELPELLRDTNGVQVEKIAALQPDLILAQYTGLTEEDYNTLSQLPGAKVVAQSGDFPDYGMPWQDSSRVIGQAVGRSDDMDAIITDVEGQIAQVKTDNPGFAGQTAAIVSSYEGLFLYGTSDPRVVLLTEFGFDVAPLVSESDSPEFGLSVSAERTTDLADVGVTVWYDREADQQVSSLFEQTAAFDEGRYLDFTDDDGDYYTALGFVTPLSIPYVLERYVPQLAAAADGDVATEPPPVES